MTRLVSREISESAGTPTCFGFYIARLGKSNRFRKAKSASRTKAKLYEGGAALSYGDFFILRTEVLTFAHLVDSFIAAPVIVRPLSPRHSRESGNPQGGEQRLAALNQPPSARRRVLAGGTPALPGARTCPCPSPRPSLAPANSARLWTTRATRNGASAKTAPPLSMGPTPFSVGYCRHRTTGTNCLAHFNGPNAFQRWIPDAIAANTT